MKKNRKKKFFFYLIQRIINPGISFKLFLQYFYIENLLDINLKFTIFL